MKTFCLVSLFLLFGYILFSLFVWRNVARGDDLRATSEIKAKFLAALSKSYQRETNLVFEPTHNKTMIIESYPLPQEDIELMQMLTKQIQGDYTNRIVSFDYRPQTNFGRP